MDEIERIQDQLRRSHDGEAWHGPAIQELLSDVSAEESLFRPSPEVHSIREIARLTNRSEDSIKSHLYRTRRLLLAP